VRWRLVKRSACTCTCTGVTHIAKFGRLQKTKQGSAVTGRTSLQMTRLTSRFTLLTFRRSHPFPLQVEVPQVLQSCQCSIPSHLVLVKMFANLTYEGPSLLPSFPRD